MHNVPTQQAIWQGARLLLISRTAAAKPRALQVRHGRMQSLCHHFSALSHQHNSPLPLTDMRLGLQRFRQHAAHNTASKVAAPHHRQAGPLIAAQH
jgi:hypothetical protein